MAKDAEDAEFNVNCGAKIVGSLPSIAVTENGNSSCSRCGPEYFNEILKVLLYDCEIEKWLRSSLCTRIARKYQFSSPGPPYGRI